MQRSTLRFENAIKSEHTKKIYNYYLRKFLEFAKISTPDGLLQLKDEFLQTILEDYLFYLKKRLSPNSIPPYFAALELFFAINDKILNFKKLKKMFPATVKRSGQEAWHTEHVQSMLSIAKTLRSKAIIHVLVASGMRLGAISELKLKHIRDIEDCKAIIVYEGSNDEYWTFLTPEATRIVNMYLEKRRSDGEILVPESPLIRKTYRIGSQKVRPASYDSIQSEVSRLVKKAAIPRIKLGHRYNIQLNHGFRKRFTSTVKSNDKANLTWAEKLSGHKGVFQLDGNYVPNDVMKAFEEFKKHIENLTIDEAARLKAKLSQSEQRRSELEKQIPTLINEAIQRAKDEFKKDGWTLIAKPE
jgi:integrase